MKKYIISLFLNKSLILFFIILNFYKIGHANNTDWWILWNGIWDKLRKWEIEIGDLWDIIVYATDFFMSIAATVSVMFIIIWAYKILFGSISQDKTKWRDTILMAIWGFIIAALSWFIVRIIFKNFS